MPLSEDEVELLARQRMLKNVLPLITNTIERADPQLSQELDEIIGEFVNEARDQCSDAGDAERIIECVMAVKQDREPEVRDRIRRIG